MNAWTGFDVNGIDRKQEELSQVLYVVQFGFSPLLLTIHPTICSNGILTESIV